jgi:hypothetical protein
LEFWLKVDCDENVELYINGGSGLLIDFFFNIGIPMIDWDFPMFIGITFY